MSLTDERRGDDNDREHVGVPSARADTTGAVTPDGAAIEDAVGGSADAGRAEEAEGFSQLLAAEVLPEAVTRVLEYAHEQLSKVPDYAGDAALTTRTARNVAHSVAAFAPLKKMLAKRVRQDAASEKGDGEADEAADSLVADLLSPDPDVSARGAQRINVLLDRARTEHRANRRAARRAGRAPAEERAAARERTKLEQLRKDLARARVRLESLEGALEESRTVVESLNTDIGGLQAQLYLAEHQLQTQRASATELPTAVRNLLAALQDKPSGSGVVQTPHDLLDVPQPERQSVLLLRDAAKAALSNVMPEEATASVETWLPMLLQAVLSPPRLESFTDLTLTVDVLGGGNEIGGSCVLISAGGTRVLIDCGTRPGGNDEPSMAPRHIARALEAPIDAVVVTHAHNDHCGWVPVMVAKYPNVPVIVTRATGDLLGTMWDDAAKVMRNQIESEWWKGGPLPPYSQAEVHSAMDRIRDVEFGRKVRVGALTLQLFPAGHIVGAAGVVVSAGEQRVVISGDVSGPGQMTVGGIRLDQADTLSADLMLLESTYPDQRDIQPRHKVLKDFVRTIEQTVSNGGVALVPSFALGRAQEVALVCAEYLPDVDVVVDGLARTISDIYERYDGANGEPLRIFRNNVRRVEPGKTIDEIHRMKSGVVIATSGMLASGPAVSWAQRRVLKDPNSALLLVGYQDPESPGQALLRLSERGGGDFELPNRDGGRDKIRVLANVQKYSLGAHANADELVGIADRVRPGQLMLVHGDERRQPMLGSLMKARGRSMALATDVWQPPLR